MRSRKSRLLAGVLLPAPLSLTMLVLACHYRVEASITAFVLLVIHSVGLLVAEFMKMKGATSEARAKTDEDH